MIEEITIDFENCYGIKRLTHTFNFRTGNPYIIYAPNGVMKSSFAKTFKDFSQNTDSSDRIHADRTTKRLITAQDGIDVPPESVFVIEPYDEEYRSKRISTLAVSADLKVEFDEIYERIGQGLEELMRVVGTLAGVKKDVAEKFSEDFSFRSKDVFVALGRLEREVRKPSAPEYADLKYSKTFSAKILEFVNEPDFVKKLSEYTNTYEKLIEKSKFFKKGIFNHNNASVVAKNLKQNGWFDSGHSVTMNSTLEATSLELKSQKDLEDMVQKEKDEILNDATLKESFDTLDPHLDKNADLRDFREVLARSPGLAAEYLDVGAFKQKVWIAYLNKHNEQYNELLSLYDKAEERLSEIIEKAKGEATSWLKVIDIFNERFSVPFKVRMVNQDDVILKREAPNFTFEFIDADTNEIVEVDQKKLFEILSNGEKRALYILNIIFEVEARKQSSLETLFIVDDIADSFDYKNKYAIIEYLKDIRNHSEFHQILLTHNFDFYRTACSRLGTSRTSKLHTARSVDGISLVQEKYQKNPFNHWIENQDNLEMMLASIPFVRNLSEYAGHSEVEEGLTTLLHIKQNTKNKTVLNVEDHFNKVLGQTIDLSSHGHTTLVFDLLKSCCQSILDEGNENLDLEKKIVLAMGIRMTAEDYMVTEIADPAFVENITSNQTYELIEEFKNRFAERAEEIRILERVSILTPENIHLNSFMYEPILDMSNVALKELYAQTQALHL